MVAFANPLQQQRMAKALHPKASRLYQTWLFPETLLKTPDPWQVEALTQAVTRMDWVILNCSRQVGKTKIMTAVAYITAALGGFVLVLSPSDAQSMEFLSRVMQYHHEFDLVPESRQPTMHEVNFSSGGRIMAKPNNEKTIRIYSEVELLIIEEASRVPDPLFQAVSPMISVSKGRTMLLSTPFGKRGFFWKEWNKEGKKGWRRHCVPWWDCPRITPEFIESERLSMGDLKVSEEYECSFNALSNCPFDIDAMMQLERGEYDVVLS